MKKRLYVMLGILLVIFMSNNMSFPVQADDILSFNYNYLLCYSEGYIPSGKKLKKKDGFQYYVNDDGTITTVYYYGSKKNVVIPSKIAGKKVTCIGADTFLDNFEITSVIIPNTVISIGDCAFSNCKKLKKVTISKNVKTIGTAVFVYSDELKTIEVDSDNQYFVSIGNVLYSKDKTILYAYPAGKKKSLFTVPNGVRCIKEYAFSNCDNLKRIVVSNSVNIIENGAFAYSDKLENVELSDNITEISARLVEDCVKLKYFTIPDKVTKIGENAFYGCYSLTSIRMPYNLKEIGALAFYNCDILARIDIVNNQCTIHDEMDVFDENTVIYCNQNSNAMQYALKYNHMYFVLGEDLYPKSIILDKKNYVYNGKIQQPKVIIKDSQGNIIDSSYYTIAYIGNCKEIGFYQIHVNFNKRYKGRLIKEFKIIPKSVTVTSVKPQSKGFVIKWKKQNLKKAYYQIEYSTNIKFKDSKMIKLSKMSNQSCTVKKLKSNKKYYVRMRICKGVYKDIYYYVLKSEWSKTVKVKTKK